MQPSPRPTPGPLDGPKGLARRRELYRRPGQAEKLDPHPQVVDAFGFWKTKPRPMISSRKSITVPLRSAALLDASLNAPLKAIDMVNIFSHSTLAPPPSSLGPGTWLYGSAKALMRRVQASNTAFNLFHTGFTACNDYKNGLASVSIASAAMLFIVGKSDQMTPPKSAQALINEAKSTGKSVKVVSLEAGHQLMSESPDGVLMGLKDFLAPLLIRV